MRGRTMGDSVDGMPDYPTAAAMDSPHLRIQFALAIVQGYVAKNSMPGNPEKFVQDVWALADQLAAAQSAKKKP
jgi:hypothetical protein